MNNKNEQLAGTVDTSTSVPAGHKVRLFSHSTYLFSHHIPTEFVLLGVIEGALLMVSFYVGLMLHDQAFMWEIRLGSMFPAALLFCASMMLSMIAFGIYQRQPGQSTSVLTVRIGGSMGAGMVMLGVIFYFLPGLQVERGAIILAALVSFVMIMTSRLMFRRIASTYDLRLRALVLGSGKMAQMIREVESDGAISDINILYYMPMPGDETEVRSIPLAVTPGALSQYVRNNQIDLIVLAMDDRRNGLPMNDLLECKMSGVEVLDLPTFFERHTSKIRLDILRPSWLFLSTGFQVSNFRRIWKRLFDVVSVLLLAPIVLPIALLAAFAILVECRFMCSIFYTQTRVGQGGRLFQIYKFRSMVANAEQDGVARWAEQNDSRITWVGGFLRKYRLDELPQLYNILKGDMSFIGPRPERPEFVMRLAEKVPYYNERHRVKPGLSGWAQIRYCYGASEEDGYEKLQYDLYYVKNYSILLDALILLQTVEVVLLGRGSR
jgi:sugar transferase (PEP-CTERM system associated)